MKVKGFPFYAVEGRGHFPADMLRFDCSILVGVDQQGGEPMDELLKADGKYYLQNRVRLLIKCDESGFTCARWLSFGWSVVACAKTLEELRHGLKDEPMPFVPPHGITHLTSPTIFYGYPVKPGSEESVEAQPVERQPLTAADERRERRDFEAWATSEWGCMASVPDNAWLGWKGRAELQAVRNLWPFS